MPRRASSGARRAGMPSARSRAVSGGVDFCDQSSASVASLPLAEAAHCSELAVAALEEGLGLETFQFAKVGVEAIAEQ